MEKKKREKPKDRKPLTKEQIRAYAKRHVEASAKLEGRGVPEGYVRSEGVHAILAKIAPEGMRYNRETEEYESIDDDVI